MALRSRSPHLPPAPGLARCAALQLQQAYVGMALAVASNRNFIIPQASRGWARVGCGARCDQICFELGMLWLPSIPPSHPSIALHVLCRLFRSSSASATALVFSEVSQSLA